MTAIDLNKQETLSADPKAIQLNFTGNLERAEGATMFFSLLMKQKELL